MLHRVLVWLDSTEQNKLIAAVFLLILGWLLRDVLPHVWRLGVTLAAWIGKQIGGRFGFRYFEKSYLDWLLTELSELKLPGIVSAESSKKPKLDQVFVSIRFGEQQNRFSAAEAASAVVAEMEKRRGKVDRCVLRALQRDIDQSSGDERKDAERIILNYLARRRRSKLVALLIQQFRKRDLPTPTEETLLQEFFQTYHATVKPSAEYAAILLRKALRDQQRLAILGSPGAGKTTLLSIHRIGVR